MDVAPIVDVAKAEYSAGSVIAIKIQMFNSDWKMCFCTDNIINVKFI